MPSSIQFRWAIDWDDTREVVPFSEAVAATQTEWNTGPRLGNLQTPQPSRGSFQLYDPDGELDPVAHPGREHLTVRHRVYLYSGESVRWRGWAVVGRRVNSFTARIEVYGEDYVRLAEDVIVPPFNVAFPELDPTDNLTPTGSPGLSLIHI